MAANRTTERQAEAAKHFAEDVLTVEEIAAKIECSPTTLYNWNKTPEFVALIEAQREVIRKRIRSRGISIIENRVAALQDRWERMRRVIDERAAAPEMQDVPGGKTGILIHRVKGIGKGEDFRIIDEYEPDAVLLKELREHEQQAAKELGQWTEKRDIVSDGKPIKAFLDISDGE